MLAVMVAAVVLVLTLHSAPTCALRCQEARVYYEVIRAKHPDAILNKLSRHDLWLYFEATKPVKMVPGKSKVEEVPPPS